jgi:hypothetical protein
MRKNPLTFVVLTGLLTALTLSGIIIVIFQLFGPHGLLKHNLTFKAAGAILFIIFPPVGGGL